MIAREERAALRTSARPARDPGRARLACDGVLASGGLPPRRRSARGCASGWSSSVPTTSPRRMLLRARTSSCSPPRACARRRDARARDRGGRGTGRLALARLRGGARRRGARARVRARRRPDSRRAPRALLGVPRSARLQARRSAPRVADLDRGWRTSSRRSTEGSPPVATTDGATRAARARLRPGR